MCFGVVYAPNNFNKIQRLRRTVLTRTCLTHVDPGQTFSTRGICRQINQCAKIGNGELSQFGQFQDNPSLTQRFHAIPNADTLKLILMFSIMDFEQKVNMTSL